MLNELDLRWTLTHGPGPEDEEVYEDDPFDEDEEDFDDLEDDAYDDEDDTDDEVDHFYDNDGKLVQDTFDDDEDE